jgi:hypothetical protein
MSLDSQLDSKRLAALIVDALARAGIVPKSNIDQAIEIAAEEIDVRKAAGDYWCEECELRRSWNPFAPSTENER